MYAQQQHGPPWNWEVKQCWLDGDLIKQPGERGRSRARWRCGGVASLRARVRRARSVLGRSVAGGPDAASLCERTLWRTAGALWTLSVRLAQVVGNFPFPVEKPQKWGTIRHVDDFQALISSLGESTVAYLGKGNLDSLSVFGDPVDMTASIEICLRENSWERQSAAIDTMLDIRGMFLDEVSLSYRFVTPDSSSGEALRARQPDFCMA